MYGGTEFCVNLRIIVTTISSGVFTGAIVILLISIKEYIHERKKALMNIYSELFEIRNAISDIKPFLPNEPIELVAECLGEIDRNSFFEELNNQLVENNPDIKTNRLFTCSYSAKEKYKYLLLSNMTNEEIVFEKTLISLNETLENMFTHNMEQYTLELEKSIDSYLKLERLNNKGIALAIEELDFIFGNKTIKRRYEILHERIIDALNLIHNNAGVLKSYYEKGAIRGTYCHIIDDTQKRLFREDERCIYFYLCRIINNEMRNTLFIANGKKPRKNVSDQNDYIVKFKQIKMGETNA